MHDLIVTYSDKAVHDLYPFPFLVMSDTVIIKMIIVSNMTSTFGMFEGYGLSTITTDVIST